MKKANDERTIYMFHKMHDSLLYFHRTMFRRFLAFAFVFRQNFVSLLVRIHRLQTLHSFEQTFRSPRRDANSNCMFSGIPSLCQRCRRHSQFIVVRCLLIRFSGTLFWFHCAHKMARCEIDSRKCNQNKSELKRFELFCSISVSRFIFQQLTVSHWPFR